MSNPITRGQPPDPAECIEQAYFFRTFRERIADNVSAQDALDQLPEQLLSTTRLPFAVQFLATELKHAGLLNSGFARLSHYFTPFQAFVVRQAEQEGVRFALATALLVLEREAAYKAGTLSEAGLFVYQFEAITRNRLGYEVGLTAVGGDPFYGPEWKAYIDLVSRQLGVYEFSDLVYVRSESYVLDQRRNDPTYEPPVPPLFADKEGRIAKASRGRDPLFLFSALQRQLNYPEVPKPKPQEDVSSKVSTFEAKLRDLEARLRMLEAEQRGTFDPTQFGKPQILDDEE